MGVTKPGRLAQWYNYLNSSDAITRYCISPQPSNNFLDGNLTATLQFSHWIRELLEDSSNWSVLERTAALLLTPTAQKLRSLGGSAISKRLKAGSEKEYRQFLPHLPDKLPPLFLSSPTPINYHLYSGFLSTPTYRCPPGLLLIYVGLLYFHWQIMPFYLIKIQETQA